MAPLLGSQDKVTGFGPPVSGNFFPFPSFDSWLGVSLSFSLQRLRAPSSRNASAKHPAFFPLLCIDPFLPWDR